MKRYTFTLHYDRPWPGTADTTDTYTQVWRNLTEVLTMVHEFAPNAQMCTIDKIEKLQ